MQHYRKNNRRAQRPTCPVCGALIPVHRARIRSTCGNLVCRARFQRCKTSERWRELDKRFAERHARRVARATAERDASASVKGVSEPDAFQVIVIHANGRRLAPLPDHRRREFKGWLQELVERVLASPVEGPIAPLPADVEDTPLLSIYGATCGTCRGRCCLNGGTRAFLDPRAIQRFRHANRKSQPQDIVDIYCRKLPQAPYENSCVYHTQAGCALPRDLRSDTCNSARCGGLNEIRWYSRAGGQKAFFVAAMRGDEIVRSEFIFAAQSA